jgi:Xaa-Pro aminopeptidase
MNESLGRAPLEAIAARRARLVEESARESLDAILVFRPEHVRYLTGIDGTGPRALLIGRGTMSMVAPAETTDADLLASQGIDLVTYRAYAPEVLVDRAVAFDAALGSIVRSFGSGRVACDIGDLHGRLAGLRSIDIVDAEATFARARRPRDRWEVGELRARVAILDAALRAGRRVARTGATELDVALRVAAEISTLLGEMVALDHNIGSGPRSALADPQATTRTFTEGDLLLVDLYPLLRGYYADLTRTWSVGPPTSEARRMHEAVVTALRAGEELLEPGAPVAAIDAAVRRALRSAGGRDASMGHHSGHGLGIFAWEHPWIGSGSGETLLPGDVVALEPGTYLAGVGGVRIEGDYLITDNGHERLDALDEDLVA